MATTIETLQIALEVRAGKTIATLDKVEDASSRTRTSFEEVRKEAVQTAKDLEKAFSGKTAAGIEEVQESADDLARSTLSRVGTSIEEVEQAQRALNKAFRQATTDKQRKELAALGRQLDAVKEEAVETARAVEGGTRRGGAASNLFVDLSRGVEDLRFGLPAVINNLDPFAQSLARVRRQAQESGQSLLSVLLPALGGPGGLLFLFNAAATAAFLFGDEIVDAFKKGETAAEEAQRDFEDALDAVLQFESGQTRVITDEVLPRAIAAQQQIVSVYATQRQEAEETLAQTRRQIQDLENEIQDRGGRGTQEEVQQLIQLNNQKTTQQELVEIRGTQLDQEQKILERYRQRQRELQQEQKLLRSIESTGGADPDGPSPQDAEKLARARERLEQQLQRLRIEGIEDAEKRARELIRQRYAEALELARKLGDAEAVSALETGLQQALDRSAAAFRQQFLDTADAFSAELEATGPDIFRILEQESARINKQREAQEQEIARIRERALRTALRLNEQLLQRSEQLIFDALTAIEQAAGFQRQFSDEQIALRRDQFREEERQLENSLQKREISQEQYSLRMREIARRRAEFEKEVERDRASFMARSLNALADIAIATAVDVIKAEIAKAAATQARKVIEAIPFPFNIIVAPLAIAAVLGLKQLVTGDLFAEGGYTGPGGKQTPAGVVHRGEFVLTKKAVGGDPAPFYGLLEALERRKIRPEDLEAWLSGADVTGRVPSVTLSQDAALRNLGLPGFQDGGLVEAGAVLTVATQQSAPEVDLTEVTLELRRLGAKVERLSARPIENVVVIGDQDSRRIVDTGEQTRARVRTSRR